MQISIRLFASILLSLACRTATAAPAAPEKSVQLPYGLTDSRGNTWSVNQDGSISDANGQTFESAGHLAFGNDNDGNGYVNERGSASFDATANEVLLPVMNHQGLNVSRRVGVNAKGGWCRFVEVLENPTNAPVRVQLRLAFSFSQGIQVSQPLEDAKAADGAAPGDARAAAPRAVAVYDGNAAMATIAGGHDGRVRPTVTTMPNDSAVNLVYDIEVPARQTAAIAHFQLRRRSLDEASDAFHKTRDRELLAGLPRSVSERLVNFARPGLLLGDDELLRGDVLDVVELRNGDRYKGTLQAKSFKLTTAYGPLELPADQVLSVLAVGQHRPVELFVTRSGEVFGGTMELNEFRIELSNGHVAALPMTAVSRVGYRKRPNEPAELKFERPMVSLAAGDRLAVDVPSAPVVFLSPLGKLALDAKAIASIAFDPGDDRHAHEVRLRDGSRLTGVLASERLEFKPVTVGGGRTVGFEPSAMSRVQLASDEAPDPGEDDAVVSLANGDRLVGAIAGKLVLETAFDAIAVEAAEVMQVEKGFAGAAGKPAPSDVQVTLWDGAVVSGRLQAGFVECSPKSGGSLVRVPLHLFVRYEQPLPTPPAQAVERIRAAVAELSGADEVRRAAATARLAEMGPGIRGVLRSLRPEQSPAGRAAVDRLIGSAADGLPAAKPNEEAAEDHAAPNGDNVKGGGGGGGGGGGL